MQEIAEQLRAVVAIVGPELSRLDSGDAAIRTAPGEWSKKEILGHLIDSAANNHQRFVRAVDGAGLGFPPYAQNEWVRIQRCNERPWASLVSLWAAYNDHLSHVIACIPDAAKPSPCNIGTPEPVALEFVVTDYLRHLKHHLKDILGGEFL
jgi:hypothetical protein